MLSAQQAPAPTQQGTVFRAATNYVTTDVLVRDKDGKFIPDLRKEDFEVYEDGVLQTVQIFNSVIGGRVFSDVTTLAPSVAPSEGLILPPSRPRSDTSGRIFIIFIDDLHLQAADTPRVRDVLADIRDTIIHENDLVGFVSSGTSSIAIDPSYDFGHRRFNEAISKVMGSAPKPSDLINEAQMENSQGPIGLRHNAHVAFRTVYDMIRQLSAIVDRRKTFIYVSSGYTLNPFYEGRYRKLQEAYAAQGMTPAREEIPEDDGSGQANASTAGLHPDDPLADPEYRKRNEFAEADLLNELAQVVRDARRANVTFYPVDPRGLMASLGAEMQMAVSYSDWRDYIQVQTDSLKVLAEETGGFCVCQQNDIQRGLQRIDAETSDYYLIGYTSSNPDPLKVRRQIKIVVKRDSVGELVYRPEYTIPRSRR
jgi:VWFA-related protein